MTDALSGETYVGLPQADHGFGTRALVSDRIRRVTRLGAVALVAVLLLNVCFLAIRVADGLIPKDRLASTMLQGFERGAMGVDPWPRNVLQGRDRYSDCITAQIAVLGDTTLLSNALAPRLMSQEQIGHSALQHNPCEELLQYLNNRANPQAGATYTRFWHGAATALNVASLALPLDGYRALLLDMTLGLIAATAVCAALAGPRLLIALAPLLVASFTFDGQIGYGQLLSYGPAAIATWSVALALLLGRNRMTDERMVCFAVTAGAVEAFFDQMISVPLAAAIFVVIAGTITADPRNSPTRSLARMSGIAAAWGCGLVGSYAIKLGLSTLVLGHGVLDDFIRQFAYRAGTIDPEIGLDPADHVSRLGTVVLALVRGGKHIWRLGYTDSPGLLNYAVEIVGAAGWALAATSFISATRERRAALLDCGAGYIAASLVVAAWFVLFPEHVLRHTFTARVFLIWIIGGWGWLCSARMAPRGDDHRPSRPHAPRDPRQASNMTLEATGGQAP